MRQRLGLLVFFAVLVSLYFAFVIAPEERIMGAVQRLMYFHIASAWNAFLAFGVVGFASVLYLSKRSEFWDRIGYASAEVGVLFTTITLLSGSAWAKAAWGTWWEWEPQLTTTLILWFIYIGYLFIHSTAEGSERQARFAAIWGIIGLIDIPIVYFSVKLWRGLHPSSVELHPTMALALAITTVSFTLLYIWLMLERQGLLALERRVATLKEKMRQG